MKPTVIGASERYKGGKRLVHLELELELEDGAHFLDPACFDGAEHYAELHAMCCEANELRYQELGAQYRAKLAAGDLEAASGAAAAAPETELVPDTHPDEPPALPPAPPAPVASKQVETGLKVTIGEDDKLRAELVKPPAEQK